MPYVYIVYIVECSDGTLYVGSTWNLELRIHQHNSDRDGAAYTRSRRPVRLVWAAWFDSIAEAFAFDKRVQGWRREKRIALIEGGSRICLDSPAAPLPAAEVSRPPEDGG